MFKKTEDTEWSRFSRALSGQSRVAAEPEEGVVLKEEPQDTATLPREATTREAQPREAVVRESPPREAAPAVQAPVPAPVKPGPTASPYLARAHAAQVQEEEETVIGVQSSFDGNLRCESNLRIKGSAQGEIACEKSVFIEESAKVNANVKAANAVVAGELEGSITCEGRLEILATGRVTGELTAGVLIIQEGAFFEGHLKMKDRTR